MPAWLYSDAGDQSTASSPGTEAHPVVIGQAFDAHFDRTDLCSRAVPGRGGAIFDSARSLRSARLSQRAIVIFALLGMLLGVR